MNRSRSRLGGLALSATMALAACTESGPDEELDRCPQTFEFGNFGCGRVRGTVRDGGGQPVSGALVTLVPPTETTMALDAPQATTGADGAFFLEIHRFDRSEVVKAADTLPMYLHGFVAEQVRDSVLIDVIFVPVDSVARTVQADLILPAAGSLSAAKVTQ